MIFMFHCNFLNHNSEKNKFMVRQIQGNIEHKFQMMMMMIMMMIVVMMIAAKYSAKEGRRGYYSQYCCSMLSWFSACFEALGLCRY